ncbi:MAG TPA: hypothetical protein VK939_12455 [Longimicrobiales bacterium]|nr:hypothetical protein [Longimicrobiales bacterium]
MKKRRPKPRPVQNQSTLERARDELFSAIRQCGVLGADADDQVAWMDETLEFMRERHPELAGQDLEQLRVAGLRFCQPVIPHGREHTALSGQDANAA